MMILSIFNNFSKKYFLADKNVHTASNGILVRYFWLYTCTAWENTPTRAGAWLPELYYTIGQVLLALQYGRTRPQELGRGCLYYIILLVRYFWLYSMGGHAHKSWAVTACTILYYWSGTSGCTAWGDTPTRAGAWLPASRWSCA